MKQPQITLYAHPLCPYVQRSVILLMEKSIPYTRVDIDLDHPPTWFQSLSPLGRVPALQLNQQEVLFESAVICEFLDEITPGSLHPSDPVKKAKHRAWIEFGSNLLDNIGNLYNAKQHTDFEHCRQVIQQKFIQLENILAQGPYFSGKKFCIIDAVYGPIFRYFEVFDQIINLSLFKDLPKLRQWKIALMQRESVKNAVALNYPQLLINFVCQRESYLSEIFQREENVMLKVMSC